MSWTKRALKDNEWRMEIGRYTLILERQIDTNLKGKKILKFECGVFIGGDDYNEDMFYSRRVELHTPKTKDNYSKYVKKITHECLKWIYYAEVKEHKKFFKTMSQAMGVDCSNILP